MAGKNGLPQRIKVGTFVCRMCRSGVCDICLDVVRSVYASDRLCKCKRQQHDEMVTIAISAKKESRDKT